jgi:hypothetical protein
MVDPVDVKSESLSLDIDDILEPCDTLARHYERRLGKPVLGREAQPMSAFSHTTRALAADRSGRAALGLVLAAALLAVWLAWLFLARITLYQVSDAARLLDAHQVAADLPLSALGHVRPGQPAQLRLDSFPWSQYGVVPAIVTEVAGPPDSGRIQIVLAVGPGAPAGIPLQPGLTGTVEIATGWSSPAELVLRAAGQLLGAPPTEL